MKLIWDVHWGLHWGVRLFLMLVLTLLPLTATAQIVTSKTVAPGMQFRTLEYAGARFAVVSLDLRQVRLQMRWRDPAGKPWQNLKKLQNHLETRGERVLALMNAGIFDTNYAPLGLHVEQGRVLHALSLRRRGFGNFYLQPNGVFYLDQRGAHVTETMTYQRTQPRTLEATQSGPMLVINNRIHPAFQQFSENRLIRNGVGVESASRVHLVLALDPVNFYDFARLMRDVLDCPNALYLDGNVSSLRVPGDIERDGDLGPMIVVLSR